MRKMDFTPREPNESVGDLARRYRIPNRPVTQYQAMEAIRDILKLDRRSSASAWRKRSMTRTGVWPTPAARHTPGP